MNIIPVALGQNSYSIYVEKNCLPHFETIVPETFKGQTAVIITDEIVGALYTEALKQACLQVFGAVHVLTITGGESAKSLANFSDLCEKILALGITRRSVLVALGGGIIGDLVGYVAASLLRGIPFIQIPTSLLAQVDSSVGGKTGINSSAGKNLIGAFYQPALVMMNTEWLKTLPVREMRAGYAEILKYGLLYDAEFYNWLLAHADKIFAQDETALTHAILRSCAIKAEIVSADEFETKDVRALLNLGHTFAHAIETLCGYDGRILHGEAVAIGLVAAAELSCLRGEIMRDEVETLRNHLDGLGFVTKLSSIENLNAVADDYIDIMKRDKKAMQDRLVFILLSSIGTAYVDRTVLTDEVRQVLKLIA